MRSFILSLLAIVLAPFMLFGAGFLFVELAPARMVARLPPGIPHPGRKLDLSELGGGYLVLQLDPAGLNAEAQNSLVSDARAALLGQQITFSDLGGKDGAARVRITDPALLSRDRGHSPLEPRGRRTPGGRLVSTRAWL